jgi:hypothetical protein
VLCEGRRLLGNSITVGIFPVNFFLAGVYGPETIRPRPAPENVRRILAPFSNPRTCQAVAGQFRCGCKHGGVAEMPRPWRILGACLM